MIAKNIFIKGDILMERQDGFIRDGKEKDYKEIERSFVGV